MENYFANDFAELVWKKKYAGKYTDINEFFKDATTRLRDWHITQDVAKPEFYKESLHATFDNLEESLKSGKFLFGGRIMSVLGDPSRKTSYYNCTNINILDDSLEGIFDAMYKVARLASYGQGVGIDFSVLRPREARVNNAAYTSTGAVSYMELFDGMGKTIAQDGNGSNPARRMAMLFTLRVDHPDILEFIDCKKQKDTITNANISAILTKSFLDAVKNDADWDLVHNGKVYNTVKAKDLMYKIAESNHTSAEPGVLFLENAKLTALPEVLGFPIVGFNACTEASLDYAGVCNLGSVNLAKFRVARKSDLMADSDLKKRLIALTGDFDWWFDGFELRATVEAAVVALDTVVSLDIDENRPSIPEQKLSQSNVRRIGLGIMGLADMLALAGVEYGSADAIKITEHVMSYITNAAYATSAHLANLYGKAPAINNVLPEVILDNPIITKLTDDTKNTIYKYGLRNAAIMSIAPTGSISNVAGCTSGAEPLFRKKYTRFTRINGDWESYDYTHPVYEQYPDAAWVEAKDVKPSDKLKMVAAVQSWVDQSVANTGNFPPETTVQDIIDFYYAAFDMGIKGLTVYVENDETKQTRGAVLVETAEVEPLTTEDKSEDTYIGYNSDRPIYEGSSCRLGKDGLPVCD